VTGSTDRSSSSVAVVTSPSLTRIATATNLTFRGRGEEMIIAVFAILYTVFVVAFIRAEMKAR
jgi:hypothetical protein